MRKRVQIALAVLLVALGGVIAWQVICDREPVYQGKRLSVWLREARMSSDQGLTVWLPEASANPAAYLRACQAVRQFGTNAIPTLLEMVRQEDSSLVSKLMPLWERGISRDSRLPGWIRYPAWYRNQAYVINSIGAEGFRVLGADAQEAAPALIRIYEQNISWSSQGAAAEALAAIGPAARTAIPSFLRGAASSNVTVRWIAVQALSQIHEEPLVVVPALAKLLEDRNNSFRFFAARGLGGFGTNARQTVPALGLSLSDPDVYVREAAAIALMRIDSEAATKAGGVPVLIKCLRDSDVGVRLDAARGLGDFGAGAQQAIPALVPSLSDPDGGVRNAATNALKQIDPEAAAKAGVK